MNNATNLLLFSGLSHIFFFQHKNPEGRGASKHDRKERQHAVRGTIMFASKSAPSSNIRLLGPHLVLVLAAVIMSPTSLFSTPKEMT